MLDGPICIFFELADIRKECLIDRLPVFRLKDFIDILFLLLQMPLLFSKSFLSIAYFVGHCLA